MWCACRDTWVKCLPSMRQWCLILLVHQFWSLQGVDLWQCCWAIIDQWAQFLPSPMSRYSLYLRSLELPWVGTLRGCMNVCSKKVQQRLALYHGVRPVMTSFSEDAEKTFTEALSLLQVSSFLQDCRGCVWLCSMVIKVNMWRCFQKRGLLKAGEEVALVQSGRTPIWRTESTHHIQVRKVSGTSWSETRSVI